MRAARAAAAVLLGALLAGAAFASNVMRVQAEGAAPLPVPARGAPPPPRPTAEELRALRQTAVADGIERAVLDVAARLARESVRGDEAALRAALGKDLAALTLGHGVVADLGEREVRPRRAPGEPPPRRKPGDPIPREHAWRIEALVDGDRVLAALRAVDLALSAGAAADAVATTLTLAAPVDARAFTALRARLVALGAASVVPRQFSPAGAVLEVRGLDAARLARRLASEPPVGFRAETDYSEAEPNVLRVRLAAEASGAAGAPAATRVPD